MTLTGNKLREQFLVHMNVDLTIWKILPSPSENNLPLLDTSVPYLASQQKFFFSYLLNLHEFQTIDLLTVTGCT